MKHLGLLLFGTLLLGLSGISCETPANSDPAYGAEVAGLSGSSAAGAQPGEPGSVQVQNGRTNAATVNSPSSNAPGGQPLDTEPEAEPREGELEMAALSMAYPQRIRDLAFRDGDWALRIDETWYYWAKGRLLPEELRDRWEE